MRKLSTVEVVTELLRTYQEVTCTLNAAGEWVSGKPGSRTLDRPAKHPYNVGSYRELEAILVHMRDQEPVLYWAVAETYVRTPRRIVEVQVKRKAKNNRTVTSVERRSVPVVSKAVRPLELEAGVAWVTGEFDRRGVTPFLPFEIYAEAAA